MVNQKREASLGERVDLSVRSNKKGSIAVRKWYHIEDTAVDASDNGDPTTPSHLSLSTTVTTSSLSLIPVYFHPNVLGDWNTL